MTITRSDNPPGSGFNIGVNEILSILLERIWILILCAIIGGIAGYSHWMSSPKIYASHTTLLVTTARKNVMEGTKIQGAEEDNSRDAVNMNTSVELIRSKDVALRVVRRLKLTESSEFLLGEKPGTHLDESAAAERLQGDISAIIKNNTNLIILTVQHQSPKLAQKLSDIVAEEFILKNIQDRSEASTQVIQFLTEQVKKLDDNLHQADQALQKFSEDHPKLNFNDEEWKNLNSKFDELRKDRVVLEGDFHVVESMGQNYDTAKLLDLESIKNDPTVRTLQASVSDKEERNSVLARNLQADHPKMRWAVEDLQRLKQSLNEAAIHVAQGLPTRYDAALAQEKQLEGIVLERNKERAQYDALNREVTQNSEMVKDLRNHIKDVAVSKALAADDIKISEAASYPIQIEPSGKKIMLTFLGAGVMLGILLAFALNLLDNSIKSPDQIESTLHLPALSVVPESPSGEVPSPNSTSPQDELNPAVREAFRSLVVSMKLLGRKGEGQSFLFTSALPAEGKTFCSFHTSLQIAAQGHKIVLIDADLRKPLLHKLVPNARLENGLSDVLADQLSVDDALQETMNENFYFISAGSRSPNPQKLLASTALPDVIAQLAKKFEYIIIDSAPVNAVADTLLIALHVQRICLIARAGSTPERAVIRAIQALFSSAEKQPSGVVLNRYKRRRGLYYYYNYSYHKSYGYYGAYGEGEDKRSEEDEKAS